MSQTKLGSLVESVANILVGFTINYVANLLVLPLFGLNVTPADAFGIGVIFTVISLVRSYVLRRWFNGLKFGNRESRMTGLFPEDSAERKTYPVYSGLLQYFPAALAAIAHHSHVGNEKHNPGQPLHHDRAKSDDEADALVRHLMEADYVGMAWRALALLQKHCEANGSPIAPAARNVPRPVVVDGLPPLPPQAFIDADDNAAGLNHEAAGA